MKLLLHIIITLAMVYALSGCTLRPKAGFDKNGQPYAWGGISVGGKTKTKGIAATDGKKKAVIYVDETDHIESYKDTTRAANSLGLGYLYSTIENAKTAADVAKVKSGDAVTTTSIQENAATSRLIDTNATSVKLLEP